MTCLWLWSLALLFVLVTAGPVQTPRGRVSLPLKHGGVIRAPRGSNVRRGDLKRSRSSIIADLKLQLEHVKRKYFDEPAPVSLRKRASSESINLTDIGYDYTYFAPVEVGTPRKSYATVQPWPFTEYCIQAQTFNIEIGIGSADFWLASEFCCSNTTITKKFNSFASKTWVNSTKGFEVGYISGNVTGWIGTDTVSLGQFTVEGQTFGVADYVPEETQITDPLSGLMGFGWQALAAIPGLPWWQGLVSRGEFQEPLFGVYIARHLLEPDGGALQPGGSLDLGFTNTAYYTGDITYSNLTAPRKKFWQVAVQSLTINNHIIQAGRSNAIVDIGTSWIVAPTNIVKGLFSQVPGSKPATGDLEGFYIVPCKTNATLSFTINNVSYPISITDWIFNLGSGQTGDVCVGTISGYDSPSYTWVLGGVFLKNVYSVYRYDPPSVGFAQLSPAVRYAGTGNLSTSSIPVSTSSSSYSTSSTTTSPATTTSLPHSSSTTTSKGAAARGAGLSGKGALSTCISTLLWITLSLLL